MKQAKKVFKIHYYKVMLCGWLLHTRVRNNDGQIVTESRDYVSKDNPFMEVTFDFNKYLIRIWENFIWETEIACMSLDETK